mmetsp:Transcript_29020/g.60435  ORF Transcript_29020/g.60435 Transcript_29020/m.60435 type:complete len:264 (+) Transcript_29020:962-1753(+)
MNLPLIEISRKCGINLYLLRPQAKVCPRIRGGVEICAMRRDNKWEPFLSGSCHVGIIIPTPLDSLSKVRLRRYHSKMLSSQYPRAYPKNKSSPQNSPESLGIINASALANALLNSSPVNCPVNTVSVPLKYSFNSSSYGPVPTKHILALSPNLSNTGLISFNRFSPPNRPTYTMRNLSVSPSVILLLISSLSNLGSNRTVSIPFRQTSTRGTPCSSISAFICGLVTRVRSARECTHRSSAHASSSRAGIHCPYCRAYSGRWVW